ncbi:MAG: ketoacyl-ACP synthase III [Candidatus Dormibacteria bacterium]
MRTSIKSVGTYVPPGILTNADLEKMVETSDTWIRERTGIVERHIAAVDETSTDLAIGASLDALTAAGLRPEDTDLIVCSTSTPDSIFPSVASRVQERLQAHGPAFDVQAACTGFLVGLSVADRFVSSGEARQALVIGTETLTKILNFKDRGTCVVFGDGAGAVVLGPGRNGAGIKSCLLGSDGTGGDLIYVAPGADSAEGPGRPEIRMDGRKVFRFATEILAQATLDALARAGVPLEAVKLIVPHQANARIIEAAGKRLGVASSVMANNIAQYGNTSTASIPLALKDAVTAGRLSQGDHIVLVGFGAGLTWGACVVEWEGAAAGVAA